MELHVVLKFIYTRLDRVPPISRLKIYRILVEFDPTLLQVLKYIDVCG